VTVFMPTTTQRDKKPLKLNVTRQTLERLVALKLSEGHRTLSDTLVFLLDRADEA
jgi:hypothetical protein